MDSASLVARILELTMRQPPPPAAVLEDVVRVLMEARGGGDDASRPPTAAGSEAMVTSLKSSNRSRPPSSSSSQGSLRSEPPTAGNLSLMQLGQPDTKMAAYLARHERRHAEGIPKPVNLRERKVVQYQALCEGQGGKHVHADYVQNGSTQIAGHQSFTPSLLAGGGPTQLAMVSGRIAAGKQPYNADNKFNFRP